MYRAQARKIASSIWPILPLFLLCGVPKIAQAQVPVNLAPVLHPQFVDSTGKLLAGGFLYTYQAGTTTLQATYSDPGGTILNPNPIPLDASGAPSNGAGTEVQVWFTGNTYKVCAYNSALVLQWCSDNVPPIPFLAGNNAWTGNQTFAGPSTFNGTAALNGGGSLSGIFSGSPNFSGNPTFSGNPAFTGAPNFVSATPIFSSSLIPNLNAAGQSNSFPNAAVTGTTAFNLVKLTGNPSTAVLTATADTGGVVGVCIAGCGTTGTATVQNIGGVPCDFDGATTAGDYVTISPTSAGQCHDAGSAYSASGQVIGRVLSTNGGAGAYSMNLFPAEINKNGYKVETVTTSRVTAANSNTLTNLMSFTLPANEVTSTSQLLRIHAAGFYSLVSSATCNLAISIGGVVYAPSNQLNQGTPSATVSQGGWSFDMDVMVTTTGASGTFDFAGEIHDMQSGSPKLVSAINVGSPTSSSINWTTSEAIAMTAQWSAASASNTITESVLRVERLN